MTVQELGPINIEPSLNKVREIGAELTNYLKNVPDWTEKYPDIIRRIEESLAKRLSDINARAVFQEALRLAHQKRREEPSREAF